MNPRRMTWTCVMLVPLGPTGCAQASLPPPVGTGAADVVQAYFDALLRRDWPAAYNALDSDSQGWLTIRDF